MCLHALYKRIGYVIIPKPHFSSREGIISRCRRFDLLHFPVLVQSDAARPYMIAVVAAQLILIGLSYEDKLRPDSIDQAIISGVD